MKHAGSTPTYEETTSMSTKGQVCRHHVSKIWCLSSVKYFLAQTVTPNTANLFSIRVTNMQAYQKCVKFEQSTRRIRQLSAFPRLPIGAQNLQKGL